MGKSGGAEKRAGRPRSAKSHEAILRSTLELLAMHGYQGLSIEAVAGRAGVGKATIYRRWASKKDLAFAALQTVHERRPLREHSTLRQALLSAFKEFLDLAKEPDGALVLDLFVRMIGEARANPSMLRTLTGSLFEPRISAFKELFDDAKKRGEIRPHVDALTFLYVLSGSFMMYATGQQIFADGKTPRTAARRASAEQLVDGILYGFATPSASVSRLR
jgi:AcrR family transcriptional regulator